MMRNNEFTPPLCTLSGEACAPCPAISVGEACGYLALGEQRQLLLDELEGTAQALAVAESEVTALSYDRIIPNALTPKGMDRLARTNTELQAQLKNGTGGVLFLDIRGLKLVNDTIGYTVGNVLLRESGERISEAVSSKIRTKNTPVNSCKRRRRKQGTQPDIVSRPGGDEIALFLFDISPKALKRRTAEIGRELDVYTALKDDEVLQADHEGRLPIIASVAGAHASELPQDMRDTLNPESPEGYVEAYQNLLDRASARHDAGAKKEQYATMAALLSIRDIHVPLELDTPQGRRDNLKAVGFTFFTEFLPGFMRRAHEIRSELGLHDDPTA